MDNKYFTLEQTLFEITENHPATIAVFSSNGFPQMSDPDKRSGFGKNITLNTALSFQNRDASAFSRLLISSIERDKPGNDITLGGESKKAKGDKIKVTGLLPCPVRIPLLESFAKFMEYYEENHDIEIEYELKAASMGLDWVEKNLAEIKDESGIPDLFISAGFDLFFDEEKFGKLKQNDVFKDEVKFATENKSFNGYELKDPRGHYSMIGVVPAVFLVNTTELGNRAIPESWSDILKPEYENSVSLPVGDFDLFNAILLNIHRNYGTEGVEKLGRSLLDSLHPSEMVKSERKIKRRPSITIMPYFFTKTIKEGSTMKAIWPKDGAILSPIFMLSKADRIDKLKDVINFFASKQVGEILSHSGLFPSTNPDVDNKLKENSPFMWLGWDYIYSINVAKTIRECENIFNASIKEAALV
jgi:ABC-type Fe3+ transport system substrate-binding protein